jgi:hypothetical protein
MRLSNSENRDSLGTSSSCAAAAMTGIPGSCTQRYDLDEHEVVCVMKVDRSNVRFATDLDKKSKYWRRSRLARLVIHELGEKKTLPLSTTCARLPSHLPARSPACARNVRIAVAPIVRGHVEIPHEDQDFRVLLLRSDLE